MEFAARGTENTNVFYCKCYCLVGVREHTFYSPMSIFETGNPASSQSTTWCQFYYHQNVCGPFILVGTLFSLGAFGGVQTFMDIRFSV